MSEYLKIGKAHNLTLEDVYKKLYDGMVAGNLSRLLFLTYEIWGFPSAVIDICYNLIDLQPKVPTGDPTWDAIMTNGRIDEDTQRSFIKGAYMVPIMEQPKAQYIDWGVCRENPRVNCKLSDRGELYGVFAMITLGHYRWTDEDNAVYELIANACTQVLRQYGDKTTAAARVATKEWLFLSLLENGFLDRGSIHILEESLRLTDENKFRLVKLVFGGPTTPHHLEFMVRKLHSAFPQMLCVLSKTEQERAGIYILVRYTRDEDAAHQLHQLERFYDVSAQCQLNVSKSFADLAEIPSAKIQVDFLSEYFSKPHQKGLHKYEYHALDHVFKTVTDHIPSDCYTPEAIRKLEAYDRKNHTDYLNTLYVYLRSFLNSKKTVEYFGFHRNTLLHRLSQIQAITDIHLDDEQELLNLLLALELRQSKER